MSFEKSAIIGTLNQLMKAMQRQNQDFWVICVAKLFENYGKALNFLEILADDRKSKHFAEDIKDQ